MLLLYSLNLQAQAVSPLVELKQFGARENTQDHGGAEKLARKTVSDRNKRDAEIKDLLEQVQARQDAQTELELAQSTQGALKTQSNSKRKAKLEFKLAKQPVIAESTQLPTLIINDDFDMDLIMAMLSIE